MTSPNEWWKEEPFASKDCGRECSMETCYEYDIEAIIEEVKRREREKVIKVLMNHNELYCHPCLQHFLKIEGQLNNL